MLVVETCNIETVFAEVETSNVRITSQRNAHDVETSLLSR